MKQLTIDTIKIMGLIGALWFVLGRWSMPTVLAKRPKWLAAPMG